MLWGIASSDKFPIESGALYTVDNQDHIMDSVEGVEQVEDWVVGEVNKEITVADTSNNLLPNGVYDTALMDTAGKDRYAHSHM